MSEKRFELDVRMDMPKLLIDTATNERYNLLLINDIEEIVDLLNELSDENNILNKNEDDLKECTIENIKLKEENEQLHYQIIELQEKIMKVKQSNNHYYTEYYRIKEENEELRQQLNAIKENPINYF